MCVPGNACAGHASCSGQGFVAMPTKACADVGGKVKDEWRGTISKADLVHCYGVNVCKGHNDCKTANNACVASSPENRIELRLNYPEKIIATSDT